MVRVRSRPLLARLLTGLTLLALPAAAQSVHFVKPDGTGDFLTVQAAVTAAAPGDLLIVGAGFYENVVIDKALSLVAPQGALISAAASGPGAAAAAVRVTGLQAHETVVLSGFTIFLGPSTGPVAPACLLVEDSAGTVWVQDCFSDSYTAAAFAASDAASVVLVASTLQANLTQPAPDGSATTEPGGRVSGASRVYGYDAHWRGSHGSLQGPGLPTLSSPPHGGHGLHVTDALVHLAGGSVTGGGGNTFHGPGCALGGDGGDGLVTEDGAHPGVPSALLRAVAVSGGSAGFASGACAPAPVPGAPFDVVPGTLSQTSAAPRSFIAPGHALQGAAVTLKFKGVAGDVAFLLVGGAAAPGITLGNFDLHLRADAVLAIVPLPLVGSTLDLPVTMPVLPPGFEGLLLPLQAVFADAQGLKHGGNPRALILH